MTICLNMIVKDEAHCIAEGLRAVAPFIDYYVISDTGSTDGTQEVIKSVMDEYGIQGEIHSHEWVNFGHNRTLALEAAKGKADYIYIQDADDLLVGTIPELTADAYDVQLRRGTNVYTNVRLVRSECAIAWRGVVHEYLEYNGVREILVGCEVLSRTLGSRSLVEDKYERDAKLLKAELERNPECTRSMFYYAQSLRDSGDLEGAHSAYMARYIMGGTWTQEVYLALVYAARINHTETLLLKAIEYMPERLEAYYELMKWYCDRKMYDKAYAIDTSRVHWDRKWELFMDEPAYTHSARMYMGLAAWHLGYKHEARDLWTSLLGTAGHDLAERNLKYC